MKEFVYCRSTLPFRHSLGDVRREFTQRLSVVLHVALGPPYHRDGKTILICYCMLLSRSAGLCPPFVPPPPLLVISGDVFVINDIFSYKRYTQTSSPQRYSFFGLSKHLLFYSSLDPRPETTARTVPIFFIFFAPPGYGTGREPAPTPSTGGVLQA
jgi:hypothetical protein